MSDPVRALRNILLAYGSCLLSIVLFWFAVLVGLLLILYKLGIKIHIGAT